MTRQTIDIGRIIAGFRASIKGVENQLLYGILPEDIAVGIIPRIAFADYDPVTRAFYFTVGRDGKRVGNSDGVIAHGKDMRVTFSAKGSFRFTDGIVSMATYPVEWDDDKKAWYCILPEGMVLEQQDNLFELAGI